MNNYPSNWEISHLENLVNIKASSVDKKSRDGHDQVQLCNYMDVFNNATINISVFGKAIWFQRKSANKPISSQLSHCKLAMSTKNKIANLPT